jgi:hypothetical protein
MEVDLKRQLRFPPEILSTKLRPDIVIWSSRGRKVILLELTVPCEELMEDVYNRKMAKYQKPDNKAEGHGVSKWRLDVGGSLANPSGKHPQV